MFIATASLNKVVSIFFFYQQWDVTLARGAQGKAEMCDMFAGTGSGGMNFYYNRSETLPSDFRQRFRPDSFSSTFNTKESQVNPTKTITFFEGLPVAIQ